MSNPRNLSSFTLIVTFVCLSLIGVVLVPLLPVKLAPSRTLPGLTVSFSMPGNSVTGLLRRRLPVNWRR